MNSEYLACSPLLQIKTPNICLNQNLDFWNGKQDWEKASNRHSEVLKSNGALETES